MSRKVINMTLPVVINEIEHILETYPKYPYQQAFTASGLRQDLVAYVLTHVPNQYAFVNEKQNDLTALYPPCSSERILEIEHWIHLGIRDVLHIYQRSNCYLPQMVSYHSVSSLLLSEVN